MPKLLYVVRAIWTSPENKFVPISSVQSMRSNWPFCARMSIQNFQRTPFVHRRSCQEHGHNEAHCPKPRCKACGSSDHRNSSSFACPEHKCSKCKGTLDPKGRNKNNRPQILSIICTFCEEVGHDEERCPTRPCPACGNRTHKSPTHFECPEHICATCDGNPHWKRVEAEDAEDAEMKISKWVSRKRKVLNLALSHG